VSCLRTTGNESVPGAMVCAMGRVWLPVAHRPISSLQSGCSCEPVIYFHLAVLARSLKENPMTIALRCARRARKRERRENGREGVNVCVCAWTKACLCSGIKDVQCLSSTLSFFFLILILLYFFSYTGNILLRQKRERGRERKRERNSCIFNCKWTIIRKTLRSSWYGMIRRRYLMRSYVTINSGHNEKRILFDW